MSLSYLTRRSKNKVASSTVDIRKILPSQFEASFIEHQFDDDENRDRDLFWVRSDQKLIYT